MPAFHLTVITAFANRKVAERITDPADVAAILSGAHRHKVVKTIAAEEPAPPAPVFESAPAASDPPAEEKPKSDAPKKA